VKLDPGEEADEARPEMDRDREIAQETLETLTAGISSHWMGGLENLESVPGIIGTSVMGVSTVEMVTSTVARMSVLYAWKGPGLWMMAEFWGTAFQIITMPSR
jgi:UDP-N-acetylenolpyruvoylglucosamine reductase